MVVLGNKPCFAGSRPRSSMCRCSCHGHISAAYDVIRGLPSCRNFISSHYEDVIRGDDGNMIAVGTFSVTVDAQVTHEDARLMLEQIIEAT